MPFDFLKRKKPADEAASAEAASPATPTHVAPVERGIAFDGLTEEWRIVGTMHIETRLSDALNRRESVSISDVQWAPIDGSAPMEPAPGLKAIDPYDLIIVLAGESTLPDLTEDERAAHRIHKVPYDVAMEIPPFRVVGRVQLHPGTEPERLLDRGTEMFVPVVEASAYHDDELIGGDMHAVLVNRFYLRGIEQVDRRTGEPAPKLPGQPLGGTSWQDRTK